ncbi:MAG: TraR/DksA C4-type zinc finger protein [Nitrospinota bacterium]
MEETDRARLKVKIVADLAALECEIASLKKQTKPIPPDNAIGRLTRMEAIQAKSVAEAALARIDSDDYGICIDCGEEIPLKRLELMPESLKCVHCADKR